MPIYEYRCNDCEKEVSIFFLSFADAQSEEALCPECGSKRLERSLARTMDDAARKSSANYGDDFKEVKSRLEKGESATSIEKSMRKRVGESMESPH
jgi:putative FmdB family regulatory protein